MKIREFGVRGLGLVCALIAAGSASQHAPATALNADLAVKGHTVVNINAAVSGYYQGVLTSPVTLKLGAGCYQITDGFGKDPAALYDAFNYHLGVAADWAWQYRVVNLTTSATLLYVAAPSDEAPATMYATEAAASAAGQALLVHTFCLEAGASVGFVVDDNYVPDNTGGISLLISDPIPLDRLTLAGPTVLTLHNAEIRAWEGYSTGDSHPVYYSTFNGKSTSAIEQFPGAETTVSPALGSAGGKIYVATLPANANDVIYVVTGQGASTPLCDATQCARSKAKPALFGIGSTLYAAWTALDGTIGMATYTGDAWSIDTLPVPGALTTPTTGPALSFFRDQLILAWTSPSGQSVAVDTATLPLSSGSWSSPPTSVTAETNVAPALGILFNAENQEVLHLAWTTPAATIGFASYEPVTASWTLTEPPFKLPSGPLTALTPAFGSTVVRTDDGECRYLNTIHYTVDEPTPAKIHIQDRQVKSGCP